MVLQHSSVGNPYIVIKLNTCYGMPMQGFPTELCCNTISYNYVRITCFTAFYRQDPYSFLKLIYQFVQFFCYSAQLYGNNACMTVDWSDCSIKVFRVDPHQCRVARPFFSTRRLSIRDHKRLLRKGLVTLQQKTRVQDSPAAWLVLIGCGPQLKKCQFGRYFVITFKAQVWRAIHFLHGSMSVLYQFLKNHLLQLLLTGVVCYKKKLLLHHPQLTGSGDAGFKKRSESLAKPVFKVSSFKVMTKYLPTRHFFILA